VRVLSRLLCAALAAGALAACSSGSSEPRAKFREPVFTVVDAASLHGVERLSELLAGDVNADGKPDALVGYYNAAVGRFSHAVYLGSGDGSFRPAEPVNDLFNARLADFNGDGRADLAGCNRGPRVVLGGGDGRTWTAVALPPAPSSCEETAIGDFDGDGVVDFAFGMRGAGSGLTRFAVLHGVGDGTFRALGPIQNIDGLRDDRPGFFRLLPGRFNADARADLAVFFSTGQEGYLPEVRLSNGNGLFAQSWPLGALPAEFIRRSSLREFSADLNGDGRADLVVEAVGHVIARPPTPVPSPPGEPPPPPMVLALMGRGDGTFGMPTWTWPSEGFSIAGVGDVDRDARLDLVFWKSLPAPAQLYVAFGRGDGTFLDPSFVAAPPTHVSGFSTLVDLNGDGRLDVLTLGAGLAALIAE
jgi:hypothetical protein